MRVFLVLFAGLLALPITANAQRYDEHHDDRGHDREVVCESKRGGYKECYTDFRRTPRIEQVLSNSDCHEGTSWGHRPGMVWVSRGCRAVFAERGGRASWGDDRGQVRCESQDRRTRRCTKPFRGPAELVNQLSRTNCVEGRNWGQDRRGIWVDGGCRAVFGESYRVTGGHWGGGRNRDYSVECESKRDRYRRCNWDTGFGIPYLVDQYSSSPCVRNRSWGYDVRQGYVWVDKGCRALFSGR